LSRYVISCLATLKGGTYNAAVEENISTLLFVLCLSSLRR